MHNRNQNRNKVKVQVIALGLDKEVAKASRQNFVDGDRSALDELEAIYGVERVKVARSLNHAKYKRKQRVSDRIGGYVTLGNCLFLTLTFTDAVLASTSEKTRRKYVTRWLKSQSPAYVANIDYGKENEREHYHAIAFSPHVDYKGWHKYGAIKGEEVKTESKDVTRVSKYVAKLSNHAMKVNDGVAPRLIYSRDKNAIKALFEDLF